MTGKQITIAEYARSKSITSDAVRKAITAGRLVECLSKNEKGRLRVDPEIADREWQANTAHHRKPGPQRVVSGAVPQQPALPDTPADPDDWESQPANYNASRAKREMYAAELARLEYEEMRGTLVNAEAVKKEAFRVARQVRDAMLNIPDRIAAELAAETDTFAAHKRLTDEIKNALTGALGDDK